MRSTLLLLLLAATAASHVGVNDVFFEGLAGPYPLYVTIRPPVVIPGVAEISIRSAAKDVTGIEIAPMTLTGAGSQYPPTPDQATPLKDDPQTFTGALWIMSPGAWQVRAAVKGQRGAGLVSVPVPAASQRVSTMDPLTGGILGALMVILALGVVGIAGAAVREARLAPGLQPDTTGLTRGRLAMLGGLAAAVAIIWFGSSWWSSESLAYARSIYKPLQLTASFDGSNLSLRIAGNGNTNEKSLDDFIADHGYLMHLYAVRQPKIDAVYHLHPQRQSAAHFALNLPVMEPGTYRLFADIVHASGFPETLTTTLTIPSAITSSTNTNRDDAGGVLTSGGQLADGARVVFHPIDARAGQPVTLRFDVLDRDGNPHPNLKPYLGMPAHLAVIKTDFSVFSHIHPSGNISMAAFEIAQNRNLPFNGNVLVSPHAIGDGNVIPAGFSFPFGFPSSGTYRLILQFARQQGIETVLFDASVR